MSEPSPSSIDLTSDPVELNEPTPKKEPYDPTKDRETARKTIALTLIWTLIGVLVAAFACVAFAMGSPDLLMKLLTLVFTPLVALVGSAVGFYFGAQTK